MVDLSNDCGTTGKDLLYALRGGIVEGSLDADVVAFSATFDAFQSLTHAQMAKAVTDRFFHPGQWNLPKMEEEEEEKKKEEEEKKVEEEEEKGQGRKSRKGRRGRVLCQHLQHIFHSFPIVISFNTLLSC